MCRCSCKSTEIIWSFDSKKLTAKLNIESNHIKRLFSPKIRVGQASYLTKIVSVKRKHRQLEHHDWRAGRNTWLWTLWWVTHRIRIYNGKCRPRDSNFSFCSMVGQPSRTRNSNSSGLGRAIINKKVKDARKIQESGMVCWFSAYCTMLHLTFPLSILRM